MSYGPAVKNKTPRKSFHPYHVDKDAFAIAIKKYGLSQAMLHKILNHPYVISRMYFNISKFDPRNPNDNVYRDLLLYTVSKIPSIVTLRELYRINLFFTRLQEDALASRFTNLNPKESEEYVEILKSIYGDTIPNVFYDIKMNNAGSEIGRTWVLSDMGIVNATQFKMREIEKAPCRYNTTCTNKDEEHRALFAHPNGNKMGGRISRRKMHRFRKTRLAIRKRTRNTLRKRRQ